MDIGSKSFAAILGAILILVLTGVYWNHFDNGFHFDDSHTIVNNAFIRDIGNLPLFFKDAQTTSSLPLNQAYRPIITSLNAIDHWIAGSLDPKVFHRHIFLEFVLLLFLLYLFFQSIFKAAINEGHYLLAVLATAFFAFHAATAETINYIIARSDGFSTLMVIGSFLIYMKANGWTRQWALAPFIIGCLAKPTTLMLAPILLTYELLITSPSILIQEEKAKFVSKLSSALRPTISFFIVGLAMYFFTRSMFSETWQPSNVKMLDYLNTQPYIFWIYIKTFFYPNQLTADTDLTLIKEAFSAKVILGLTAILGSLFVAYKASLQRKTLLIAFGILWFYIALIPSSSIIPLAEVMNHHRTFFPYIGLVMATAWAVYLGFDKLTNEKPSPVAKTILGSLVILVLASHAYGTYQRNEVWHNDISLWKDVTIKSPNNGRGLMNYGLTELRLGKLESAIGYFDRAMKTSYRYHPYLYTNMGIAKNSLSIRNDQPALQKEAEAYFKRAIELGPGYPDCHYHYAKWLQMSGRSDEAMKHLNRALELSPGHQMATALINMLTTSAEKQLQSLEQDAVRQNTPEVYLNLSLKYYNHGQYENCIKACLRALELRPDYAEAYNNMCSAYNKLGLFEKGKEACEKALSIKPDYELAKGNLSWALSKLQNGQ